MIIPWLLAARPKTLTIAVVPVVVGTVLGWKDAATLHSSLFVAALLGALFIQVGTNLHNDVADFERGVDDPVTRLGPTRVTAQGMLSARQVRRGAFYSFLAAGGVGLYLVWVGGWPILVIGLMSMAAGWAYTGGGYPIAYSGLGELFVWVFFGLVAVTGSYYLQSETVSSLALLIGALVGMPAAAVLVVNNYRDLENDRRTGKRTLAVRLGRRTTRMVYALLLLLPFALLGVVQAWLNSRWVALSWIVLPWAVYLIWRFYRAPLGPVFNNLLAATAGFQFVLGMLLSFGLWMSAQSAALPT